MLQTCNAVLDMLPVSVTAIHNKVLKYKKHN